MSRTITGHRVSVAEVIDLDAYRRARMAEGWPGGDDDPDDDPPGAAAAVPVAEVIDLDAMRASAA